MTKTVYEFGNYPTYYSYRNESRDKVDTRLKYLDADIFRDKKVLDIGCNGGAVTCDIGNNSLTGLFSSFI
jgi:2-polyprenyl-3-methyl-5-hydroxy-6-metoxy-1,4-benzoquinol methylase